jgi:hypothetical protein
MKERYGRDKNYLSRARIPFCKGDSSDDGRDGAFFSKKEIRCRIVGIIKKIA